VGSAGRVALLAVAAVIVFATGLLLTRTGRPYGTLLLNIHKLVDLAAVVFIVVQAVGVARGPGLETLDWALVVAAGLATVATFVTGGLLSASDSAAAWLVTAHRLLSGPLFVLLAATLYRLAGHPR